MKRNSTQLELITPGATTWLPWISDPGTNRVDGYPSFDGFSGQSRSIRESAWQAFLDSGDELEIIPDPTPPPPEPDWTAFNMDMLADADWGYWIGLSPLLLSATTSASLARDLSQLQTGIDAAKASLPDPGATASTRWQGYSDTYNIGLVF